MKKVAIIGYSGIFPDAENLDDFARQLEEGVSAIGAIDSNRLTDTALPSQDYIYGGYLKDISSFDFSFFGISYGEAEEMMPEQRLLLQEAYKTFEHANYRLEDIKGSRTSVYVGDSQSHYYRLAKKFSPSLVSGNMKSLNAGRISRFFDLRGGAYSIDTACSSSLIGIIMACKDLQLEEVDMALICGVNLEIFPKERNSHLSLGVESALGSCRPFSSEADGTLSGETACCVLLKDYEKAVKDGDLVYGIINGFSSNQDASLSSSITAPSGEAQSELLKEAISKARLAYQDITYIEAHGTGTKLGDPIEIEGISKVFSGALKNKERVHVSSVKSNIGHTNSAAGLAGLMKVLLSFKNDMLFPSVNALPLNQFIDFEEAKVKVVTKALPWSSMIGKKKRIAGVSSFGLMGTNAHVIIEEPEERFHEVVKEAADEYTFCFSARSEKALKENISQWIDFLKNTKASLKEISPTLNTSRSVFEYRYLVKAKNSSKLIEVLQNKVELLKDRPQEIILVFDSTIAMSDKELTESISSFPVMSDFIEGNSSNSQKSLLLQYHSYKLLCNTGMKVSNMIGNGLGKLTIKILKGEYTLKEGLAQADVYEEKEGVTTESDLKEKAIKLLGRYKKDLCIVSLGYKGILGKVFREQLLNKQSHQVFGLNGKASLYSCLSTVMHAADHVDLTPLYQGVDFKKVELPVYVFDKERCWLREKEDIFLQDEEIVSKISEQKEPKEIHAPSVELLTKLWEEILKTKMSEKDDFFDLGGHSLNGQQLINRINETFGISLDIDALFEHGTPSEMYDHLMSQFENDNKEGGIKTISSVKKQKSYEVSYAQNRLWLLSKLSNNSASLHIPIDLQIKGKLDYEISRNVFQILVNRHESLRTVFQLQKAELKQLILNAEELDFRVTFEDITNKTSVETEAYVQKLHAHPFILEKEPLIRVHILKVAEEEHLIVITLHHIIADGWSITILQRELFYLYNTLYLKKPSMLPKLDIQYKDYTAWLLQNKKTDSYREAKEFWINKFKEPQDPINLSLQRPRPRLKTYNGSIRRFQISKALTEKIQTDIQKRGITLTMYINALLNIWVSKLSGKTDITLGMPISERIHKQLENQVGLYLNMIACRTTWKEDLSFDELLELSASNLNEVYKNKIYPFEELVRNLDLPQDNSRFPLFDIVFSVQNFTNLDLLTELVGQIEAPISAEPYVSHEHKNAQFDITFRFFEAEEYIYYEVEYNTDLFSEETIDQYHALLMVIIEQCTQSPNSPIGDLNNCNEDKEKRQIEVLSGKSAAVSYEGDLLYYLNKSFQDHIGKTALIFGDSSFSYDELDRLSNKLANYILATHGDIRDQAVMVSVEVSPLLIASIIGILRSGGIYVPVNTIMPQQRQDYIQNDVGAKLVINDSWLKEFEKNADKLSSSFSEVDRSLDALTYIIYTSGSTGNPKGVMISHKSILSLFLNTRQEKYEFSDRSTWTLFHNYSFDVSIWEIFGALLFGGKLILLRRETLLDFKAYAELITSFEVSILNFTPKVFTEFDRFRKLHQLVFPSVRYVVFAGDTLVPGTLASWYDAHPECELINMYGITEITVHGTIKDLKRKDIFDRGNISNVGKPIPGVKMYLLNKKGKFLPEGSIGEIYVSGDQVSLGYYKKEQLSDERFIEETFYGLGRLYKSGDLARWLPNGDLEFIGREDFQVKINGFRVELNEIKYALLEIEGIEDVHIMSRSDNEKTDVIAYYAADQMMDASYLRSVLSERLPHYMIPAFLVHVKKIVLNANGKADVSQLPDIEQIKNNKMNGIFAEESEIREKVASIFCEILDYPIIDPDMDFFNLGGNSLQLVRLHNELDTKWPDIVSVPDLFELNSINEIANFIEKRINSETQSDVQKNVTDVEFFDI